MTNKHKVIAAALAYADRQKANGASTNEATRAKYNQPEKGVVMTAKRPRLRLVNGVGDGKPVIVLDRLFTLGFDNVRDVHATFALETSPWAAGSLVFDQEIDIEVVDQHARADALRQAASDVEDALTNEIHGHVHDVRDWLLKRADNEGEEFTA